MQFVLVAFTGSGSDLDNNTFKFMDQANGRMVGLKSPDITPQIARIDAHILNSTGEPPLLRRNLPARQASASARIPRTLCGRGRTFRGCSGEEADRYMIWLAVNTLRLLGVEKVYVDIGHTAIVRALLAADRALNEEELHCHFTRAPYEGSHGSAKCGRNFKARDARGAFCASDALRGRFRH
ncbi:MAG: ATP phosphoribosyltransferase regulatory subunit [Duodenibacillus massiliensis]